MAVSHADQYHAVIRAAGFDSAFEIAIIENLLKECHGCRENEYVLLDERKNSHILGFSILSKIEWTTSSWELYWVIVDKRYQRQGIGSRLLEKIYATVRAKGPGQILVAEISSKKTHDPGRAFLTKNGFKNAGSMPDYFGPNDSLITYYKNV